MTQEQISKLFNKAKSTINEHIRNIYSDAELLELNTMRKFGNSEQLLMMAKIIMLITIILI